GTIGKELHYDNFLNPCCVRNWPDELIVYDKPNEAHLPDVVFPKWLPDLAFTSEQMRGEVAVRMLKSTKQITLKYDRDMRVKIAPWMGKFLVGFPVNEGLNAVKDLNFPHIHWYNSYGPTLAATNPDVDLMLQCGKLERVGLTFHALRINVSGSNGARVPVSLGAFLDHFKLRPMLGCKSLKHVYIGGIQHRTMVVEGGDQLVMLRDFGKWLRESFEGQGQEVTVML
ncbi:hypothetical protein BU23DRAFT_654953, partial [Bimuria novae-zelandiae CBS 107.79]